MFYFPFQLNWHRILSFFMFFVCIFGLAVVWMYGLCLMSDMECSYDANVSENKTIAIALFALGCIGFVSAAIGVGLIRSFGLAFGLVTLEGRNGTSRYTGRQRQVIDEIRRQNEIARQEQLDQARFPNLPPGLQGCTNFGFDPPSPPAYSVNAVQVSAISSGQINLVPTDIISSDPPKYSDIEPQVVLSDLPPPYTERAGSSTDTTGGNSKQ